MNSTPDDSSRVDPREAAGAGALEASSPVRVGGTRPVRPTPRTGRIHSVRSSALATAVTLVAITLGVLAPGAPAVGAAGYGGRDVPTTAATRSGGRELPATLLGEPAPRGTSALLGVACGSTRRCWAVGSGSRTASESAADQHDVVDMTSNGGASWSQQSLPISTASALSSISCLDARHCMAVGDQLATTSTGTALAGTVLVTSDGGHRWDPATSPPGSVDVVGVSCSTAQHCLVLATDGSSIWSATTTDGGEAWSRGGSLPAGFAGVSGVDCPQLSTCVVAGYLPAKPGHGTGAVADTSDAGVTWQAATLPSGIGLLHDVSCPDLQRCVAVGTLSTTDSDVVPGKGVLLTSTDGGRTFGAPRSPSFIDDAFGVSCPVSSRCVAVGTRWAQTTPPTPFAAVATTADRGSTWRSAKARFVPFGLAAVACPTATTCVAVGGDLVAALRWPAPMR